AERYRGEILLHCYRMLGSLHDAEDATQETLLRAWRGLERFEGRASPRAWLYRIATNACLTALARAKTRRVLPETQGPPGAVASVNSALQRARTTLRRLSPDGQIETPPVADDRQRVLLGRYVRAWESSDIDAFVALLKEDAVWTMPPWRQWFVGRPTIRAFL